MPNRSRINRWIIGLFTLSLTLLAALPAAAVWSNDPLVGNPVTADPNLNREYMIEPLVDTEGYTYYAWIDPDFLGVGVQKLDPAGNPLWGADGFTAYSLDIGVQDVAMCSDGWGGVYLAVEDGSSSAGDSYIMVQHVLADGGLPWGDAGVDAAPLMTATPQQNPAICPDGWGGVFVTWAQILSTENGQDIIGQHITDNGSRIWGGSGLVIFGDIESQREPSLLADGTGGAYLTWKDYRNNYPGGGGRAITRFDSFGDTSGFSHFASDLLMNDSTTFDVNFDWALHPLGGVVVGHFIGGTNIPYRQIRIYHLMPTGESMFNDAYVVPNHPDHWLGNVKVAVDAHGDIFAAWNVEITPGGLGNPYVQRFDLHGTALWAQYGVPAQATPSHEIFDSTLSLDVNSDGFPVLAWETFSSNPSILAQQFTPSGIPQWGNSVTLASSIGQARAPYVLPVANGACVVGYTFSFPYQGQVYRAQRIGRFGHLGEAEPLIASVTDFPQDQGGQVRLSWNASYLDDMYYAGIQHYSIWNRIAGAKAAATVPNAETISAVTAATGLPQDAAQVILTDGWTYVGQSPAAYLGQYGFNAPTFADSTGAGEPMTEFMVMAHNNEEFWQSAPMAGISVDNLTPGAPLQLAAALEGASIDLTWQASGIDDEDLALYNVYRAAAPGFIPTPSNLVGTATDTLFSEPFTAPSGRWYYQVSAVDVHGNEGDPSNEAVTPAVSGIQDGGVPGSFALRGNFPNPFNPATEIVYDLPRTAQVQLAVFDLAGHRVASLLNETRPAGRHATRWNGRNEQGEPVPSGVYFARLTAGEETAVWKMVLAK